MEIHDRIDRLARFLVEAGETYAADDTLDDGVTTAKSELGDILSFCRGTKAIPQQLEEVVTAFDTIGEAWFGGFDLASAHDLTGTDRSVGEILDAYTNLPGNAPNNF